MGDNWIRFCCSKRPLQGVVLVVAVAGATGTFAQGRAPVPDSAAQARAQQLIRDVYGSEYDSAKTSAQKTELAKELLNQAAKSKADPANHFVLLRVAKDMAVLAGDAETALEAAGRIVDTYDVDPVKTKLECLQAVAGAAKQSSQHGALAKQAFSLLETAVAEDEFEAARQLAEIVRHSAARARNYSLVKEVAARIKGLDELRQAHAEYQESTARLQEAPTDPKANQTVGEYCCFVQGDWERGILHLVLGSDPTLREIARQDLASPQEPAAQIALGDQWWDLAEAKPEAVRRPIFIRAVHWYSLAQPQAAGLLKTKLERRLSDFEKQFGAAGVKRPAGAKPSDAAPVKRSASGKSFDLIALVDPAKHTVQGTWQKRGKELFLVAPSPYARLRFPVVPRGSYEIDMQFTRVEGSEGIVTSLPVGKGRCHMELSGYNGHVSGIGLIDRVPTIDRSRNPTARPGNLPNNFRHRLTIRVQLAGNDQAEIRVAFDNMKDYIRWQGPQQALSESVWWKMPNPDDLGIAAHMSRIVYHGITLRMLDGEAEVLDDEPVGGPVTPGGPSRPALGPTAKLPPGLSKTPLLGDRGQAFEDTAPPGGELIGVRVSLGNFIGPIIDSVQPIYRVNDKTVLGERSGEGQSQQTEITAKAGYVVVGANIRAGLRVDAVQLIFMRQRRGQLDASDVYASDLVGGDGGNLHKFGPFPTPVVGIHGTTGQGSQGERLHGLGLVLKP